MIFSICDILSAVQLKRLSEHKYSSTGCTLLDPLMQPFWNWLVQKFPLWLAPNTMTVTGLLINIFTSLLLMYYSPDCIQAAPRWAFLLCAIGLFIYQTLDACDGKQARRTNTSSPLGELFDHGCDSLSTVFVGISVCVAVQLGTYSSWMFFQCFAAITLFYCAHWQTYVSGTLHFGKFDVTEAQFTIMFIHVISAIFGPSVWSITIPSMYIELKLLPVFLEAISASIVLCRYLTVIFTGGIGKNGSTVADTSILSPFIPMGLVLISAFTIYQKSTISVYENHPCLYILAFGMVAAKVTNKLVVAHMTKSEINYLDSIFIGPGMLFLNQYFNTFINEYIVLWLCVIYSVIDFLHYCTIVCNQICSYLHIRLFSIAPMCPTDDPRSSENSMVGTPLLQSASNDESSENSIILMDEP